MASMNYFDTVVHFDGKWGNLCLRLHARSHTIYVMQVGCSIFQPAKIKQTITHQHVLLRQESLTDGTAVTIILCLHILILHSTSQFYKFLDMLIFFSEYL